MEIDDLDREVAAIRANAISKSTFDSNIRYSAKYIQWTISNLPDLITSDLFDEFAIFNPDINSISSLQMELDTANDEDKPALERDLENLQKNLSKRQLQFLNNWTRNNPSPPLHFQLLEARHFFKWLVTLRKSNGTRPSGSTYKQS
eukprot:NODE_780_length_3936_cov_0.468335.p3 type:complete len:146 gc:universal NODE_780_length_3936_cov_0.468335:2844-2407(-)